ncbi:hypothetical protein Q4I28_006813 [Leishmania naiffi]|uniref:R27-2 protein n=1 Tax=Leishmania naiffi TaxID=5678 RepID=A0AAW3BA77_9TRYP
MSESLLRRGEQSDDATRDRISYVRAQRRHLERETRMLRMALEELHEEAEQMNDEEVLARRTIQVKHRELLRCLLHFALAEQDSTRDTAAATSAHMQQDATDTIVCELLRQYKHEQDACTQEVKQRVESTREKVEQSRLSVSDTSAAPQLLQDCICGVDSPDEVAEVNYLRSTLEALCERKAEVEEETEAALLSIGRTLLC